MTLSSISQSPVQVYHSIDYKEVLKKGLLATITVLGTSILLALAVGTAVVGGFSASLMTVDGGVTAVSCFVMAASISYLALYVGNLAKGYCLETHYALNP